MTNNCVNCGARLLIDEYKHRVECEYCQTTHVPSLADDGLLRKLEGAVSTLSCPLCFEGLSHARLDNWALQYCASCHGLLVDGEHLADIIVYCRSDGSEPPRSPDPIDPCDLVREIRCPSCASTMSTHEYYGPGDFVIDSCPTCRHVWLDAGELARSSSVKWGGSLWR